MARGTLSSIASNRLPAMDNRMVERFWCSIKYEEIYLHAYTNVPEARVGIRKYIKFYNKWRPHSSLAGKPPD